MRNSRYFFVTIAALVFITVSIIFISIWGYRTFIAGSGTTVVRDTVYAQAPDTSSSMQDEESLPSVVNDPVIADTNELKLKLAQLEQLQDEIKTLLEQRKNPDSIATEEKIKILEKDIKSLQKRNRSIIANNRRLEKTVTKLVTSTSSKDGKDENTPGQSNPAAMGVKVTDISLYALTDDLAETSDASVTRTLRGSFFVKSPGVSSGELVVIVMGPDGKVLMNGPWESGYFDTPGGRKLYSTKLQFQKEEQRVNFSLNTEHLKSGIYVMQIYYKGGMLATLRKTLT